MLRDCVLKQKNMTLFTGLGNVKRFAKFLSLFIFFISCLSSFHYHESSYELNANCNICAVKTELNQAISVDEPIASLLNQHFITSLFILNNPIKINIFHFSSRAPPIN